MDCYSMRFKKAVVELYHVGRTVAYLHQEYSVPKRTIYNWIRARSIENANYNKYGN